MSSNHRPTLESKKGKKRPIGDTIVHSRNLPQQTKLKFRSDAPFSDIGSTSDQTASDDKRRLLNDHEGKQRADSILDNKQSKQGEQHTIDSSKSPIDEQEETSDELKNRSNENNDNETTDELKSDNSPVPRDAAQSNDQDKNQHDNLEDESDDSEYEDESDTEALLQELNNIKREKEKQQQEQEDSQSQQSVNDKLQENPLIDPNPKKKSWRSSTFKRNNQDENQNRKGQDNFTTNSIESEFHQSFLSKYIR